MAMVERLTIIRGVEKFELQTKTARWVLAKEEGYSPVQNARFGNWRLWGIRVSIRFGKFAHSL